MIDRRVMTVDGMEGADLIVQALGELAQGVMVGAPGMAGIADAMLAVEDHAAGAFEEHVLLFEVAEVDGAFDCEALLQHLQHAFVAFQAAVLSFHRVQHQAAVGVAAPPVVGEDRIRSVGRGGVLYHQHFHAMLAQGVDVTVELFQRFVLCGLGIGGRALEAVVDRGVRVKGKVCRADHQDGIGGLHGGTSP